MSSYQWQKSSYSGTSSNCLNVAAASDSTLLLRESDNPGSTITATPAALGALINAIRRDRFTGEGQP
ncbi:DUF397 domain-containing protein [Streptomyces sp. NPDC051173]|uniref:DUF397 domain-containing protein n=1 Tax=Streptomyces sp. NPDC051173 TaxID=3155164 RepID=UPI003450D8A3